MKVKEQNVPVLRFPGFEGKWEKTTIGQVANYENGKAHEKNIDESGEFIVVNSKFISTCGKVKKYTKQAYCPAHKEDILMVLSDVPNGRAIAKCFYVDSDNLYTVNQRICKITSCNAVSRLLFYVLNRNVYFLRFDDGVKQTNLRKDDVLSCKMLLPKDSEEQQKIAAFLTAVDSKIEQLNKKKALLEQYKKGMMQKLFSQEIRFKDEQGNEFPDWELKKLGELAIGGFSNGVFNDPQKVGTGYRLINVKDMYTGNIISVATLSRLNISEKEFAKNKVKHGDTFFTRSSLVKEGIAYSNVFLGKENDVTYDGHLIRMRLDLAAVNPIYLAYQLKTNQIRRQLVRRGKTTTMTTIGQQDVATVKIDLAPYEEQRKIADFLSSIDKKINLISTELNHARSFKKSLLQQMFV